MQDVHEFEQLEQKQQRAVIALLESPTNGKAAEAAGIHESTLYRWLKEPGFAAVYRAARRDALAHATARLQTAASGAVATLEAVSGDTKAPASSRVSAASKILDMAYKVDQLEEIEALLDELKESGTDER